MTILSPALVLSVVVGLTGLYTAVTYRFLGGHDRRSDRALTGSERLGLSIILAVLLLGVANNFLSALVGSLWTAVVLLAAPLCRAAVLIARARRDRTARTDGWWPTRWRDATAFGLSAAFLLSIGHRLLFWGPGSPGPVHPDLPWHVGRVAEQAFQSSAGFWPLSPLAFPGPLPFVSFVADALVSATLRYLPIPIHAYHYSHVLFCWSIVLWTAVALVSGSGLWRPLITLVTAIFVVPVTLWGIGRVGVNLSVFFFANPNSLIAWPIALALTFHLYTCVRRGSSPSLLVLLLVPPASLFMKANQAFAFGFLQALGFVLVVRSRGLRAVVRWGGTAAGLWAFTIALSLGMGSWPPSAGVRPSLASLQHYAGVAFPDQHSLFEWLIHLLVYALLVTAIPAAALLLRASVTGTRRAAGLLRVEVVAPLAVLLASMAYVLAGWWLVVPNGLAEGEPMHVNAELFTWIGTVMIAGAAARMYETDSAQTSRGAGRYLAASTSCIALGLYGFLIWSLDFQPSIQRGSIPARSQYDVAGETQMRDILKARIEDGHCFRYGRRYALYVTGAYDADSVIAMTGCPVINGQRWRGYLGTNRPELLRSAQAISVSAGKPFTVIDLVGPPPRIERAPRATESLREVKREVGRPSFVVATETRNWSFDPAGFDLEPPFATQSLLRMYVRVVRPPLSNESPWLYLYRDGQAPATLLDFPATALPDLAHLHAGDVTVLTFPLKLDPGLYQAYAGSAVAEGSPVPLGWILVGRPGSTEFSQALVSIRERGNGDRADEIDRLAELYRTGDGVPPNRAALDQLLATLPGDNVQPFVRRSRSVAAGLVRFGVKSIPTSAGRLRRLWQDAIVKGLATGGVRPESRVQAPGDASPGELSIDAIAVVPHGDKTTWTIVLLPREGGSPACGAEGIGILLAGVNGALEQISPLTLCDGEGEALPVAFVDVKAPATGFSTTAVIDVFLFSKRLTRRVAPLLR